MSSASADDLGAWLNQQQEFLAQLTTERDPERLRARLEEWWKRAGGQVGAQGQELAARLLELGKTYLQGLQQFASAASNAKTPDYSQAGAQQPFAVGADLAAAWRNARMATDYPGFGLTGAAASPWLDALSKLPPIGPAREHIIEARELAAAQAECQRLEQALNEVLKKVQIEALDLLQQRVAERTREGAPPQTFRQMYDVWIECGERAYSKTAHSEEFARLQADFANALMRMRGLQRRIAERSFRQLDLPTRAELNTLHRQMRDVRRKLNAERAATAASAQPRATAKGPTARKPTTKAKAVKKAARTRSR